MRIAYRRKANDIGIEFQSGKLVMLKGPSSGSR
jgi:hypothetical protein